MLAAISAVPPYPLPACHRCRCAFAFHDVAGDALGAFRCRRCSRCRSYVQLVIRQLELPLGFERIELGCMDPRD